MTNELTTFGGGLLPGMKLFRYRQNNSGGRFDLDDAAGIGPEVYVEAPNSATADALATGKLGIYFDGVESGTDCPCCGDRWHSAEYDDGAGSIDLDRWTFRWWGTIYIHRLDGTIVRFTRDDALALGADV